MPFRHWLTGHRVRYELWLEDLLKGVRILPIEPLTTDNDVWIAALVRQHDLPVLSKVRHFDAVPKLRRSGW